MNWQIHEIHSNYFTLQEPSLEIPSEHYIDTSVPVTVEEQGE